MGYSESFKDLKLNNQNNYKLRMEIWDISIMMVFITSRKNKIVKYLQ